MWSKLVIISKEDKSIQTEKNTPLLKYSIQRPKIQFLLWIPSQSFGDQVSANQYTPKLEVSLPSLFSPESMLLSSPPGNKPPGGIIKTNRIRPLFFRNHNNLSLYEENNKILISWPVRSSWVGSCCVRLIRKYPWCFVSPFGKCFSDPPKRWWFISSSHRPGLACDWLHPTEGGRHGFVTESHLEHSRTCWFCSSQTPTSVRSMSLI